MAFAFTVTGALQIAQPTPSTDATKRTNSTQSNQLGSSRRSIEANRAATLEKNITFLLKAKV